MRMAFVALLVVNGVLVLAVRGEDSEFQKRLRQLRSAVRNADDAVASEAKVLALLSPRSSLKEFSEAYATLCFLHCDRGTSDAGRVVEYGQMALLFQVPEPTSFEVVYRVIGAKAVILKDRTGTKSLGAQRELMVHCLMAMALVTKDLDTLKKQVVPNPGALDIGGDRDDPAVKAEREAHKLAMALMRQRKSHNERIEWLERFVRYCADTYKDSGASEEELKDTARKVGCRAEVIDVLMEKIREMEAKQ